MAVNDLRNHGVNIKWPIPMNEYVHVTPIDGDPFDGVVAAVTSTLIVIVIDGKAIALPYTSIVTVEWDVQS